MIHMSDLNTSTFLLKHSKYIKDYCRHLIGKGVCNFVHDITYGDGEISMLVTEPAILSFYHKNQIPVACTDESGRILDEGIYTDTVLNEYYKECAKLFSILRNAGQTIGLSYGKNSLHIVTREQDCQHLYSIFFDLSTPEFIHYVINNGAFLQDTIDNYNLFAKDIILEAKDDKNRITLPTSKESFLKDTPANDEVYKQICLIHKHSLLPIHLSKQQSLCFRLLATGKSSKEISKYMNISPRTVEYYLEIIRKKLGCNSSKELVFSYADQI